MKKTGLIGYEAPLEEYLAWTPDVPEGYEFGGWYHSVADFDTGSPVPATATMSYAPMNLYAKWNVANNHIFTFISRGGTEIPAQTVSHLQQAKEPADPVRENFVFKGWFLRDGTPWTFEREVSEDTTVYACWRPIISEGYTVRHVRTDTGKVFAEQKGNGIVGDTLTVKAMRAGDANFPADIYLHAETDMRTIVLNKKDNVITFHYTADTYSSYTVEYVEKGTGKKLLPTKSVDKTGAAEVTEKAAVIDGYTVDAESVTIALTPGKPRKIVFTYDVNGNGDIPKTGDSSHITLWLTLALLAAATAVVLMKKKQRR